MPHSLAVRTSSSDGVKTTWLLMLYALLTPTSGFFITDDVRRDQDYDGREVYGAKSTTGVLPSWQRRSVFEFGQTSNELPTWRDSPVATDVDSSGAITFTPQRSLLINKKDENPGSFRRLLYYLKLKQRCDGLSFVGALRGSRDGLNGNSRCNNDITSSRRLLEAELRQSDMLSSTGDFWLVNNDKYDVISASPTINGNKMANSGELGPHADRVQTNAALKKRKDDWDVSMKVWG